MRARKSRVIAWSKKKPSQKICKCFKCIFIRGYKAEIKFRATKHSLTDSHQPYKLYSDKKWARRPGGHILFKHHFLHSLPKLLGWKADHQEKENGCCTDHPMRDSLERTSGMVSDHLLLYSLRRNEDLTELQLSKANSELRMCLKIT